jgi:rod shape-determining protein MreC
MAQKPNRGDLKLFNRDTFPIPTFLILFLICLVLMGSDFRYQILKKIRLEIPLIIAPINNLINLPVNLFHESKDTFVTKELLKEKITLMEKTIYYLSIRVQENQLLKSENNILRNTLKIQKNFNISGDTAEIILPEVRNGHSIITINKGSKNNIQAGSAVINNKGLVGQIVNTSDSYSEIRPITSKSYAVPAIMDNAKQNVILYGNGNGELVIPLFPASNSIKINDIFVTSGVDTLYPKGIRIGKVTEIMPTKSPKFNHILVKPFSQPTTFSYITVLETKND